MGAKKRRLPKLLRGLKKNGRSKSPAHPLVGRHIEDLKEGRGQVHQSVLASSPRFVCRIKSFPWRQTSTSFSCLLTPRAACFELIAQLEPMEKQQQEQDTELHLVATLLPPVWRSVLQVGSGGVLCAHKWGRSHV